MALLPEVVHRYSSINDFKRETMRRFFRSNSTSTEINCYPKKLTRKKSLPHQFAKPIENSLPRYALTTTVVDLSGSSLNDETLNAIKFESLTELITLNLSNNQLQIFNAIVTLKKLIEIDLSSNPSITLLPVGFSSLEQLKVLNVSNTQLIKLPNDFGCLNQLEILNIVETPLEGFPDSFYFGCHNLKKIVLGNNDKLHLETDTKLAEKLIEFSKFITKESIEKTAPLWISNLLKNLNIEESHEEIPFYKISTIAIDNYFPSTSSTITLYQIKFLTPLNKNYLPTTLKSVSLLTNKPNNQQITQQNSNSAQKQLIDQLKIKLEQQNNKKDQAILSNDITYLKSSHHLAHSIAASAKSQQNIPEFGVNLLPNIQYPVLLKKL